MEAERERDILFLNMTEAKHRCSLKYYLWFKLASSLSLSRFLYAWR